MPRIHCPTALSSGLSLELPAAAARHVQVLRMQPGHALTLFDGRGGEFDAQVTHMGRNEVRVTVGEHRAIEREAQRPVHLVVGMPANERMDWLVEKATELGVQRITPVMTERSVLRFTASAQKKSRPIGKPSPSVRASNAVAIACPPLRCRSVCLIGWPHNNPPSQTTHQPLTRPCMRCCPCTPAHSRWLT